MRSARQRFAWQRAGQSTAEYAVLIAVIIAAVLAMQVYLKRAVAGRLRQATDQVGEQFSAAETTWNYTTTTSSERNDTVEQDGVAVSTIGTKGETTTRTGAEDVNGTVAGSLF